MNYFKMLFIFFLCKSSVFFYQTVFSGNLSSSTKHQNVDQNKKEGAKEQEGLKEFDFPALVAVDKNLGYEIIQQAWRNIDNSRTFENEFSTWKNINDSAPPAAKTETSYLERRYYGFCGWKLPIHFYTIYNGNPIIRTVGTVLLYPHKALLGGIWDNGIKGYCPHKIFIHGPTKLYSATFETELLDYFNPNILSVCFSVFGDLCVTWCGPKEKVEENSKGRKVVTYKDGYFVTLLRLCDIKNTVKLVKENAIGLDEIFNVKNALGRPVAIKGSMFSLDGTKVGICWKRNEFPTKPYEVHYLDLPVPQSKQLSIAEKAKRLGIAIEGAKELLQAKNKKSKQ